MDVQVAGLLVSCVALLVSLAAAVFAGSQAKWTRHAVTRTWEVEIGFGLQGRGGIAHLPRVMTDREVDMNTSQGYVHPIFVVVVRNIGATTLIIRKWTLKGDHGAGFTPIADSRGPDLPHPIAPGDSGTWFVPAKSVMAALEAYEGAVKAKPSPTLHAIVEAGDGTQKRSKPMRIR